MSAAPLLFWPELFGSLPGVLHARAWAAAVCQMGQLVFEDQIDCDQTTECLLILKSHLNIQMLKLCVSFSLYMPALKTVYYLSFVILLNM